MGLNGVPTEVTANASTRRTAPLTGLDTAIAAMANGDRDAARDVYNMTHAKLFGIALRILHDRSAAEDVLQTVYISVWQKAAQFDAGRASPISWLSTMTRNRSIDALRKSARQPAVGGVDSDMLHLSDPSPTPEHLAERADDLARLDACLDGLGKKHADAIRSAFLDGHSYPTLAERAAVPLGTMKSWIRRALLKLRDCLSA